MGDRGNIALVYPYAGDFYNDQTGETFRPAGGASSPIIYLYTHWSGTEMPQVLAMALDQPWAKARYRDETYLARIIFQAMIMEGGGAVEVGDPTSTGTIGELEKAYSREGGFGLSPYIEDNEHPIIYVLLAKQEVRIGAGRWMFDEFIATFKPAEVVLEKGG